MKRLLIAAAALASLAGSAQAQDSNYQEGSASRDYGYVGYASSSRHGERWSSYGGYGGQSPSYGYRSSAPAYGSDGYGRSYGYGQGSSYGYGSGAPAYGSDGYDRGYGYGGQSPGYGYRSGAPAYGSDGYGRSYGSGQGGSYGYGNADRGHERGRWEGRYRARRHRCGCSYYDDDYR